MEEDNFLPPWYNCRSFGEGVGAVRHKTSQMSFVNQNMAYHYRCILEEKGRKIKKQEVDKDLGNRVLQTLTHRLKKGKSR